MNEANAVAVRVAYVHLAIVPALRRWRYINDHAAANEFCVELIEVVDDERRDAACDAVAQK